MRQCIFVKDKENGQSYQTAWIPAKFSILGKVVKLKEEDGWKIIAVGYCLQMSDYVDDRGQDYKRTRKASDI